MPKLIKVYVIDSEGRPLIPTTPARARILLKEGKAEVYSVVPFTIKLKKKVGSPKGEFTVGIDDGAKYIGIAIKGRDEIVFAGNVRLRQDVKKKIDERRMYRRSRRSRKLRYRKARFLNRKKEKGWIPPSIRYRKEVILRVLNDLKKRLNITGVIIEQGLFDISSLVKGRKLEGIEYQRADFEGKNRRMKVLWRDEFTCQICKSKENLQVHHIIPRSKGGSDTLNNLITVCSACHNKIHKGEIGLNRKPKMFKYPTILQTGKWWIWNKLVEMFGRENVKVTFGWITAQNRRELNLEKDHWADACAILKCNNIKSLIYDIKPLRKREWRNNPTKKNTEKKGFRHYSLVKAYHRTKGVVIGTVRSLKKSALTLRTKFNDNFPVSYSKAKVLQRFKGVAYVF